MIKSKLTVSRNSSFKFADFNIIVFGDFSQPSVETNLLLFEPPIEVVLHLLYLVFILAPAIFE